MNFIRALTIGALVATSAQVAIAQTPRPLPSPPAKFTYNATPPPTTEDPAVFNAIKGEFARWQLGRLDRTVYTRDLDAFLTPDKVKPIVAQLAPLGNVIRYDWRATFAQGPDIGYSYLITCEHGSVLMTYVVASGAKEDGVVFKLQ